MRQRLRIVVSLAMLAAQSAQAAPLGASPIFDVAMDQPPERYIYDNWRHPPHRWPPGYHEPPIWRQRQFRSDDPVFRGR